jgi:pimeloyl-ACP methyl ester carboxylesterase
LIVFRSKALGLGMALAFVGALISLGATTASAATPRVSTIEGFKAPGTPEQYNEVRVVKYGAPKAKHVLVLNPGTSAGGTFFGPFANALTKKLKGWQVWAIERRENLLEDHSYLEKYVNGEISNQELFDYYLGWLTDPSISPHFTPKTTAETEFAKKWGMNVAVHDTRKVVRAAKKGGRTVVMGGHSLGGSITTAYATWDFNGKAGAKGLSGLVFIDGAGANSPTTRPLPTAEEAQANVDNLNDPATSPFITLVPPFPWAAGVFNAAGSTAAIEEPDEPSIFASWPLAPADLKPPVPTTNAGQYGFAVDETTSPANLALVQSHIGRLAASGDPRGWHDGELGSVRRAASVFSEYVGMKNQKVGEDGTSWYHPSRLSIDSGAINNGVDNPAQAVYGDHATMGHSVKLPMYSFDTSLGGGRVADATRQLAEQSKVPKRWVKTVKRTKTYSHIDPISAAPAKNAFLKTVVPFLRKKIK